MAWVPGTGPGGTRPSLSCTGAHPEPGKVMGPRQRPLTARVGPAPGPAQKLEVTARPWTDTRCLAARVGERPPARRGSEYPTIQRRSRRRVQMAAEPVVRRRWRGEPSDGVVHAMLYTNPPAPGPDADRVRWLPGPSWPVRASKQTVFQFCIWLNGLVQFTYFYQTVLVL